MPKPQLSSASGQFTLSDFDLLQQIQFDQEYTFISDENNQQIVRHHMDNIVAPILKKIEIVQIIMKSTAPIVSIQRVKQSGLKDRLHLKYIHKLNRLMPNLFELLHSVTPDEIQSGFECAAFDYALSQLTPEELNELESRGIGSSVFEEAIQPFVNALNHFADSVRSYLNSPEIKRKIRDRDINCRSRKSRCVELVQALLLKYSKILVVRVDFALKRERETLLKNAYNLKEIHSKYDLVYLKTCIEKLLNNQRHNPFMQDVIGYILRFEYSVRTGFHVHAYFMFDSNKHREDISIAQGIAKLWNEKITGGQGTTYICNMKKDSYRNCAIGIIHYADIQKQHYLFKTFDYICKSDQLFAFTNMKGARRFQLSEPPEKTTNAGRPRKQIQQLDFNFLNHANDMGVSHAG